MVDKGVLIEVMKFSNWSDKSYRLQVAAKKALFLPKSVFMGFDESGESTNRRLYVKEWWFNKNKEWLCRLD